MASSNSIRQGYIFCQNSKSATRLNYQHWLIKQLCGYLVHPTVKTDSPVTRIADIGTGTGLWPSEVSREHSASVQVDGFDISSGQYPPADWLPPNVHLHTHDVFAPFPHEHLAKYDIVHMRYMSTLVTMNNLPVLLNNLMSLLKPDGYLQWLDADPLSSQAVGIAPTTPKSEVEKMVALMRQPRPGSSFEWIPQLDLIFGQQRLEIVAHDRIPMVDSYRTCLNHCHLMGYEEYLWTKCLNENKDEREVGRRGAAEEEIKDVLERLGVEFREGASMDTEFFCIVGRKRSSSSD